MTFIAGFTILGRILAVNGLGQNTGTCGFTHTSWTAKQKRMGQLMVFDGIFKSSGDMSLSYNSIKGLWPVFSCRYNEFFHNTGAI